jgi:putative Mg2+ transporter-C (MgtC) family protein
VEGLTTAATVWMTAALGIACGLAAWTAVALAVVLALLLLVLGNRVERLFTRAGDNGATGHH